MSRSTLSTVDDNDDFFQKLKEVDNVTKNIIREIIRECAIKKTQLSESFVTYYVKLAALDPKWGLSPERSMSRSEVAYFVEECVKKLCQSDSLSIICLKMQLYFNTTCTTRDDTIRRIRKGYELRLQPIENDLKFTQYVKDEEKQKNLYNKIVMYITLKAGLGNPLEIPVQKEAFLALHSIFPLSEIRYFTNLGLNDRTKYLNELTTLVTGIRLFNRDCGIGGVGIDDVPKTLTDSIEIVSKTLNNTLDDIMQKVFLLTTVLEIIISDEDSDIHTESGSGASLKASKMTSSLAFEGVLDSDIEFIKGCLIIYRQYEIYVRGLILEVQVVHKRTLKLIDYLQQVLQKLHGVVKFRTAIPTSQVFPLFLRVAESWFHLLDEVIVLHSTKTIHHKLECLVKKVKYDQARLTEMLSDHKIITDADRMLLNAKDATIPQISEDCEILYPNNFEKLPVQFLGFGSVQLIEFKGALFPGNPKIGIVMWKKMYFTFSTIERALIFQKHPDLVYKKCLELARNHLELIFLLQLYDNLNSLRNVGKIFIKPIPVIIRYDLGVQTEIHPHEEAIVPDYKWNVWDLKREAILFSNLKNCLTTSSQTNKSNYRAPVAVQAFVPKDQYTETMKDAYTNVPTLQNFIFGLRGRKTNDQHVIELTRPVNE